MQILCDRVVVDMRSLPQYYSTVIAPLFTSREYGAVLPQDWMRYVALRTHMSVTTSNEDPREVCSLLTTMEASSSNATGSKPLEATLRRLLGLEGHSQASPERSAIRYRLAAVLGENEKKAPALRPQQELNATLVELYKSVDETLESMFSAVMDQYKTARRKHHAAHDAREAREAKQREQEEQGGHTTATTSSDNDTESVVNPIQMEALRMFVEECVLASRTFAICGAYGLGAGDCLSVGSATSLGARGVLHGGIPAEDEDAPVGLARGSSECVPATINRPLQRVVEGLLVGSLLTVPGSDDEDGEVQFTDLPEVWSRYD